MNGRIIIAKAATEMNGRIIIAKPLYVTLTQKKEGRKAHLASQYVRWIIIIGRQSRGSSLLEDRSVLNPVGHSSSNNGSSCSSNNSSNNDDSSNNNNSDSSNNNNSSSSNNSSSITTATHEPGPRASQG